ncbi:Dbl homology domain-containing protein [Suillus weaverae]|nr:Dbl homology domain-containing protein [Suillus weaverae]
MADWSPKTAFRTFDHDYEIRQLQVFQRMVEQGLIYRHYRPVHYSPSSHSALAEAELVYNDEHVSHSVYVTFPLDSHAEIASAALREVLNKESSASLFVSMDYYTLDSNSKHDGIAVHSKSTYNFVRSSIKEDALVAKDRRRSGGRAIQLRLLSIHQSSSTSAKIIAASHVTSESGSGLVHCAPAHGTEDYLAFRVLGILQGSTDIVCHVDDAGKFSPDPRKYTTMVDPGILHTLLESEVHHQTIIYKTITQKEQYVQDLDAVEALFIRPLLKASPPVMPPNKLDEFVGEVFGNTLDLREYNRRLVETMYVRQREQAPIIQRIEDVFLEAAREFRFAYPTYVGHMPLAAKCFEDEIESNTDLRLFLEECSRQSKHQEAHQLDLKHFLSRPSEHLQKYSVALEAIMKETTEGSPDAYYLAEAIEAIRNLQNVAQLRTFQTAMGKGPSGKWEWHDMVSKDIRESLSKAEAKRQSITFELIKGETASVRDLENIELIYVQALRGMDPPVNMLFDQLHDIQREEHPVIKSITAPMFDAALNFRGAYMEYIPNYPIAAYRIDDEMANNIDFKTFVDHYIRHPDAHRLDMKSFINHRLLRYELLLKGIMDETPAVYDDHEVIPQVLEIIKSLSKETESGVQSAKQKVQLWCYNWNLQFKSNESVQDMDLLNENRSLIHAGKLLRQPDTGFEWNGWTELFVLLFDNYLVMTKTQEKDGPHEM